MNGKMVVKFEPKVKISGLREPMSLREFTCRENMVECPHNFNRFVSLQNRIFVPAVNKRRSMPFCFLAEGKNFFFAFWVQGH